MVKLLPEPVVCQMTPPSRPPSVACPPLGSRGSDRSRRPSPARSLAETPGGPAIVEFVTSDARAIAVLFDVSESTWPFDVSFVVFLAGAIDYLDAGVELDSGGPAVHPGEILSQRLPIGVERATLEFLTEPD